MNIQKIYKSLKSINFWDNNPKFNLGYYREKYVDALWKASDNNLIKVITGQRRTGKSYIMRQMMHKLISDKKVSSKNIFYLNKEMFEFNEISTADTLSELIEYYEEKLKPKNKVYIFIDEVQKIDNWEKIVVSLAQHPVKKYELFITGSNSQLLSGEMASLLSGRYILTEVFPFSYKEYLNHLNLENNKENFIKYITTSALPELFNLNNDETKRHYFSSLKNTILLKDIIERNKIRDYALLEDIFIFLLHNVGQLTSVSSIVKYFKSKKRKVDYTTIAQYITYMQYAYILQEAPRFSLKTKEILSGERKYYISDLGFRNYLFPGLQKEISSILENIVYTHLRIANYNVKVGTGNNFEIDFVAQKDSINKYIQVTYLMPTNDTITREFSALKKIKDSYSKIVVSMDDILIPDDTGIEHLHIWNYIYDLSVE